MTEVLHCGMCGSPELGPHCDNPQCNWRTCKRPACRSVHSADGMAIIDNRPKK